MDGRMNSKPRWINPCGEITDLNSKELSLQNPIGNIISQTTIALQNSVNFRDSYVRKTFKVDLNRHHETWRSYGYEWLPTVPKNLGEKLPSSFVVTLDLDASLFNTYEYLQKVCVGLEQIVWDMEDGDGEFCESFRQLFGCTLLILCEIDEFMSEKNLAAPNVSRDIMKGDFRRLSNPKHRDLRDWFIFRDYMNVLEYVLQVYEYFLSIQTDAVETRSSWVDMIVDSVA